MRKILRNDFNVTLAWMRGVEQVARDQEYLSAPFECFANATEKRHSKIGLTCGGFARREVVEVITEMEITAMGKSKVHVISQNQDINNCVMCELWLAKAKRRKALLDIVLTVRAIPPDDVNFKLNVTGEAILAKKSRMKASKKTFSKEDLVRAAAVAAGLEASFTIPAPPGAMAPAPLLDEIKEMGEAGVAGVLNHLSSTTPEGRIPTLLALRELDDVSVVPKLISLIQTMRWSIPGLTALLETLRALGAKAELPNGFDAESLSEAREISEQLRKNESLTVDSAKSVVSSLKNMPSFLQEVALRDSFENMGGVAETRALGLAEAMAQEGTLPPAHFIEILAQMVTRDAATALQKLSESTKDKDTLSRIRKAIFRLKNKGIEIEKFSGTGMRTAHRTNYPDYVHAVVSAVDGRGQMLLWLARSRVPRGRYLVQARLHRGRGIVEFTDTEMSAKELKNVFRRISEIPTLASQEVPAGYAIWLLERSQRENEAGETPLPRGFTHAKLMLDPLAETNLFPLEGLHPVRGMVNSLAEDEKRMEVREIFAHRPFWSWVMDEERVAPYFQEFLQSMESQVAMDERQKKERLQQIVENSAKEIFQDKALRERIAGQLEDNAYIFHQAGDEAMARECVTLADEMRVDTDEPTSLLVEMVKYSINVMLERIVRQVQASQEEKGEMREEGAEDSDVSESADSEDSPVIIVP